MYLVYEDEGRGLVHQVRGPLDAATLGRPTPERLARLDSAPTDVVWFLGERAAGRWRRLDSAAAADRS